MINQLTILVGPQGAGKTTYIEQTFPQATIISQDVLKKSYFEKFKQALKAKTPHIVIDRINPTRESREEFIRIAKKYNYSTQIIVLNESFEVCLERLKKRTSHPTLPSSKGGKVLEKALSYYFKEYQRPLECEADKVTFLKDYDPYLLDLSKKYESFFIVGDLHGCFDEFQELLNKAKPHFSHKTAIVFLGDLGDRGPKIKECFNYALFTPDVYTIKGNHDVKLLRYLRGNQIQVQYGFVDTVEQLGLKETIRTSEAQILRSALESTPFLVKFSDNHYGFHAGINPHLALEEQAKEYLLFARTFNPLTKSFSDLDDKYWFEYYKGEEELFFGHHFHEKIQVASRVSALDGHCVFGGELRACFLNTTHNTKEYFSVKAFRQYEEKQQFDYKEHKLKQLDFLCEEGYLKKNETKNLVQYCYTDKSIYEKYWNEKTLPSRGIIYDKTTNEVIARPFSKFFNLGETYQTQKHRLPFHQEYEVYEKVDGSLGILYYYQGEWRLSTKSSLLSLQAQSGLRLLKNYNLESLDKDYTYMVEIISEETKGIIEYREEKLVLLSAINTSSSEEVSRGLLEQISHETGFPLAKKLNLSLEELQKNQENLTDIEGYVIKFKDGSRVKLKTKQYLELAKLVNHFSRKTCLDSMKFGKLPQDYLQKIPEEFNDELEQYKEELEEGYRKILEEIEIEFEQVPIQSSQVDTSWRKEFYLYISKGNFKHKKVLLYFALGEKEKVDKYIKEKLYYEQSKD